MASALPSASHTGVPPLVYYKRQKDAKYFYRNVHGSIQAIHTVSHFLVFILIIQAPLRGNGFSAQWLLWPLFTSVASPVVYFLHGQHRPRQTSMACRKCDITCYIEQSILSACAILLAIRASLSNGLCMDLSRSDVDCVNGYLGLAASWLAFASVLNGLGLSVINLFPPPEPPLKFQAVDLRFQRTRDSELSPTIVGDDWASTKPGSRV